MYLKLGMVVVNVRLRLGLLFFNARLRPSLLFFSLCIQQGFFSVDTTPNLWEIFLKNTQINFISRGIFNFNMINKFWIIILFFKKYQHLY